MLSGTVVAGYTSDHLDNRLFTLMRYHPDGDLLWTRIFTGGMAGGQVWQKESNGPAGTYRGDRPGASSTAMIMDSRGNLVVTGNGTGSDGYDDLVTLEHGPYSNQ